jgi:hypothetical protein
MQENLGAHAEGVRHCAFVEKAGGSLDLEAACLTHTSFHVAFHDHATRSQCTQDATAPRMSGKRRKPALWPFSLVPT